MFKFSWGIWDAPELWTSISKLICRTNACYFFSMLKTHSCPSCSWYNRCFSHPCKPLPILTHALWHDSGDQQACTEDVVPVCVLTTRSATPSQTLEKAVLPPWQKPGGQLFKSPDCLMSVCSIYLLFKEELLWFPPSPLYFLLFSSHFLVTFSTSLSLMCLLLILPPSTEPLSPTLQRTVLCCTVGGQVQPLLHTHEQAVLSAQSATG